MRKVADDGMDHFRDIAEDRKEKREGVDEGVSGDAAESKFSVC